MMDELERKIFAQLDDDMPASRAHALDKLRERMKNQTPPRFFRDLVVELEAAATAAGKITALETEVAALKQASVVDHQNFNQRYSQLAAEKARLQRRVDVLDWIKKHSRAVAFAAAGPLVAVAAWWWCTSEPAAHYAAVNTRLQSVAAATNWVDANGYSDPVVVTAAGEPYWVVAHFDANLAHENASGVVVTVRCVHLYANPAVPDAGAYLKPHPYSLFGWGWMTWPERATSCKPDPMRSAER